MFTPRGRRPLSWLVDDLTPFVTGLLIGRHRAAYVIIGSRVLYRLKELDCVTASGLQINTIKKEESNKWVTWLDAMFAIQKLAGVEPE